jgi:hypothetical protein
MRAVRLVAPVLISVAIATPVSADVTLRLKGSGGLFGGQAGDTTEYRKGLKLRMDQDAGGFSTSTIVDVSTSRLIMLWHDKKEADVMDSFFERSSESSAKSGFPEIEHSITPTVQTRQIAGSTCTVHNVKMSAPMEAASPIRMVVEGSYCLVKNGPGQADFTAFYRASAEKGFLLDPGQAKAQPAAAKAMSEAYRQLAELGVPFAMEHTIRIEGDGPMAGMMKKIGNTYGTEVSSVSTAPIPDSMFEIPADYKVIKR